MIKADGKVHDFEGMMKARKQKYKEACEDDFAAFQFFVVTALSAVNSIWNRDATKLTSLMTEVVTRTDEAFALWMLESNKDKWKQQCLDEDKENKEKENNDDADDDDDDDESTRFGSDIGHQAFERYVTMVEKARSSEHCEEWNKELQNHLKDHLRKDKTVIEKPKKKKRKFEKNYDAMFDDFKAV